MLRFAGLAQKTLGAKEEEAQRGSRGHKSAAGYTVLAGLGAKGQTGGVNSESSHTHTHHIHIYVYF